MGRRGRDRAKQRRVARELKYNNPFNRSLADLETELKQQRLHVNYNHPNHDSYRPEYDTYTEQDTP